MRKASKMDKESMKRIAKLLKENDNFVITAHVNPEGDAIGSELAVYYMLKKLGKKCILVNQDDVPDNLKFLEGSELIKKELPRGINPDIAVIVDCPVLERTGRVAKYLNDIKCIVNIDHHVSNEFFGDFSWVESKCSSAGEMLYELSKEMGLDMGIDFATAIYTAIVTDTGMFNYANTSGDTHRIAGELLEKGVDPSVVHSEVYENKTVPEVMLLAKALSSLQFEEKGRFASIAIDREMYELAEDEDVSTAEFINYPRSIKGVEVAAFFKENEKTRGYINVSFRSSGKIDVNAIASRLGGGGHKRASGCLVKGSLREAKEKVSDEVKKAFEEQE